MTTIPTIVVTPSSVADAYSRNVVSPQLATDAQSLSFGDTVTGMVQNAITTSENAEAQVNQAIKGNGNMTEVVTALSHAEMTLQTAGAIRDRVIQAYQDIMKMPI
jgi:flagellar hook-basal body complex protein FliE